VSECGGVICADLGSSNKNVFVYRMRVSWDITGVNRLCKRRYFYNSMFLCFEVTLL